MHASYLIIFALLWLLGACQSNHTEEAYKEDNHEHHAIAFSREQAQEFGIEYETLSPAQFNDVIKTTGSIEAAGGDVNTISAKKSGIITLSSGINPGSEVKSGERIAIISSDGIQGGDVSQAAAANLQAAKAEYERLKPLYEEKLVTASVFKEAERVYNEAKALAGKGNTPGMAVVSSPIEGTLMNLFVKSGDFVDVGQPVATVAKNGNLILKADLPVRESNHLGEISTANFSVEGRQGVVKLADFNGKKISGKAVTAVNGYIPIYFSFTGNSLSFPGGYAEVYLICGERKDVLSVPREALVELQGNKYVYVLENDNEYEKKLVVTGASDGERIEITDGLEPGDKIVSKGASIIRMAEVSAISPPAHTHSH